MADTHGWPSADLARIAGELRQKLRRDLSDDLAEAVAHCLDASRFGHDDLLARAYNLGYEAGVNDAKAGLP